MRLTDSPGPSRHSASSSCSLEASNEMTGGWKDCPEGITNWKVPSSTLVYSAVLPNAQERASPLTLLRLKACKGSTSDHTHY